MTGASSGPGGVRFQVPVGVRGADVGARGGVVGGAGVTPWYGGGGVGGGGSVAVLVVLVTPRSVAMQLLCGMGLVVLLVGGDVVVRWWWWACSGMGWVVLVLVRVLRGFWAPGREVVWRVAATVGGGPGAGVRRAPLGGAPGGDGGCVAPVYPLRTALLNEPTHVVDFWPVLPVIMCPFALLPC